MKREYFDVLRELRQHHSLFAQFWTVGNLVEIDHPRMPTAGIAFDKKTGEGLKFLINPNFWAKLSDHSKAFVIGHECLHVYFDHGRRSLGLDPFLANLAQDVVINHYLVDVFGFKREELTFGESYCWRDTMFPDRDDIDPDRCFEYYYQKLQEQGGPPQSGKGKGQGQSGEGTGQPGQPGKGATNQTVDIHDFMEDVDEEMLDALQDVVDDLMDRITPEEVENFEEVVESGNQEETDKMKEQQQKGAGGMSGGMKKRIRLGRVIKKPKWETVVANELGRLAGMKRDLDIELWTQPNRRIGTMDNNLILPATVNETVPVRDRVDVWFFQDTSGSCVDYAKRFFKAAATIPEDRFRVRMFCFDTQVYETTIASGKLYGFGGTAFQPMEDSIQSIMNKEGCKYPQAVFVITDGDAWDGLISVEHPTKWHWFLTSGGTKSCIPGESKIYKLSDYE